MLDDLISAYGNRFLVAALGVSLALLCLFIVLWILRNRAPSPFVRGGRNRQPRLQVLDAAAVDTRRRIVLVRRDNVEHLVMIGGPTDIVIESGIGDERPYLSARPIQPQALAEQQDLPKPAAQPALVATEPAAPAIASPAVASPAIVANGAAEAPARRPVAAETPRPATVSPPADPQPAPAPTPVVEQRRQQAAPVRGPEPAVENVVTAAPVAAVAAAAAPPIAAAAVTTARGPEMAPPVRVQSPAMEPIARPEPPVEPSATQPTASLEPMMVAPAPTATASAAVEQVMRRNEPMLDRGDSPSEAKTSGTPPIEAFRVEPVEPIMRNELDAPKVEDIKVGPQAAAPTVIDAPAAADLLEAARQRVLVPVQAPATSRLVEPERFEPQVESEASAVPAEPEARDMSDFERVLEEEMALHLATDPAPQPAPQTPQILPETRADRPRPPIAAILPEANRATAATPNAPQPAPEPNLQNEIARIFGEMSASRNP